MLKHDCITQGRSIFSFRTHEQGNMDPSKDQGFMMTPMLRYECPLTVNIAPEIQLKLEKEGVETTTTGRILHNDGSIKIVTSTGGKDAREGQFRRMIGLDPTPSIFQQANKDKHNYAPVQAGVRAEGMMIIPPKALHDATMDIDAPIEITSSKKGRMINVKCSGTSMYDEASEYKRYMSDPHPPLVRSSNEAIFGSPGSLNPKFNNNAGDSTSSDSESSSGNINMRVFTANIMCANGQSSSK